MDIRNKNEKIYNKKYILNVDLLTSNSKNNKSIQKHLHLKSCEKSNKYFFIICYTITKFYVEIPVQSSRGIKKYDRHIHDINSRGKTGELISSSILTP